MKPVAYLIEYCKAQIGRPYWYGTFGQKSSESLYKQKKNQYPQYYTASNFMSQLGVKVHDCAGLIKGAAWSPTPDSTPTYVASEDMGATTMYSKCKNKGMLPNPNMKPGTLVFKGNDITKSHVGVYIGNGKIIEAKGHAYGVVESTLNDKWSYWGESSLFDYSCYESEPVQTPVQEPTQNDKLTFDNSICSRCPGIALKVCTQVDPLRLRKEPNTNCATLARMPRGSTVTWKGKRAGNWYYVNYNGTWGYASSEYLR